MHNTQRASLRRGDALLIALVLGATLVPHGLLAADATSSHVGRQIAAFELRDVYGKLHRLADYDAHDLLVVVFLGTDCPLVKLYGPRLAELAEEYAPRGVAFIAVNSNRQDTVTKAGHYARRHGIEFPVLKDPDNKVADRFGATRTPEVFVLDHRRAVRYHGRIDDQYGIGFQWAEPRRRDLAAALDELLAGEVVSVPTTPLAGCLIGRVPRVEPHGDVTYSNQIARLFNRRCVECHREGEIAPFPLTSYGEAVGWAEMIREVVNERRMPPWFADPAHGHFANDARLTGDELELINQWVAHGAPEGDPAELPEPPQFVEGWRIPEPDLVFYMSDEPFTVAAEGVVDYQYFTIDPGFSEDVWIQAAEARPGNAAVVHHHVAYFVPPGGQTRGISQVQRQIAGYAPGTQPFIFPEGVAMRIPAGSKIVFQMHYTPVGTVQQDRSYVGLVLADPATVRRELRGEMSGNVTFRIPPGDPCHEVTAGRTFRRDTVLLNLAPHMHLRGRSFRFELEHPDGHREILLDVPHYDFNWQLRYDLAEPRLIHKGSRLHCYATFDNSEDNPANPDPTKEVTFGEQTWEEMMVGVFQTVEPAGDGVATTAGE